MLRSLTDRNALLDVRALSQCQFFVEFTIHSKIMYVDFVVTSFQRHCPCFLMSLLIKSVDLGRILKASPLRESLTLAHGFDSSVVP